MIYAHYTPQAALTVNDRRAGTVRVTSSNPDPIQVSKGTDTVLLFAFRENNRSVFTLTGRSIQAELRDNNGTVVVATTVSPEAIDGLGSIFLSYTETSPLSPGLYTLHLIYTDELERKTAVQTSHSRPRFIINII